MKKFLNWINKNKGAIISLLLGLFSLSELIFHWVLGEKTIYVKGFDVIGIVGVLVSIVVGVLTSGFTTTAFQEAVDKLKETIKNDKEQGLSYADRVAITKKIKSYEKELDALKKEYTPYLENVSFGIANSADYNEVNIYNSKVGEIKKKIETLKSKLN